MNVIETLINEEQAGERIDKVLSTVNAEWSRSQVQQWIKEGHAKVNDKTVKGNYKCKTGDATRTINGSLAGHTICGSAVYW